LTLRGSQDHWWKLVYLVAEDLRMSHDITVGWGSRVCRSLRNSPSCDNVDPTSCVFTSLLAIEMPLTLFPGSPILL